MNPCLFCSIVKGDISSAKRWENEGWLAIDDIHPKAATHVLLMPKEHVAHLMDAAENREELLTEMLVIVVACAKALGLGSYKLVINNGREVGQVIDHLHAHILSGGLMGSV